MNKFIPLKLTAMYNDALQQCADAKEKGLDFVPALLVNKRNRLDWKVQAVARYKVEGGIPQDVVVKAGTDFLYQIDWYDFTYKSHSHRIYRLNEV